jgi:deazaflavin-dependent oxidoreductase (nitroreductase family)
MDGAMIQPASTRIPRWVPLFNVFARPLLKAGISLGPDVLLTVRGRRTGQPRTTPVTLCEYAGRRGVISPFGQVNWVKNLRATGRATIHVGRRHEQVTAVELDLEAAAVFIRDVIAPIARQSRLGGWFVRVVDRIDIEHPVEAAVGRPVFEFVPPSTSGSQS